MVCSFYIQIANIHVKCLALEGVLQQDDKEKQPYEANYSKNYLTQHTVHISSGVKRNSHVQVYLRTLKLDVAECNLGKVKIELMKVTGLCVLGVSG